MKKIILAAIVGVLVLTSLYVSYAEEINGFFTEKIEEEFDVEYVAIYDSKIYETFRDDFNLVQLLKTNDGNYIIDSIPDFATGRKQFEVGELKDGVYKIKGTRYSIAGCHRTEYSIEKCNEYHVLFLFDKYVSVRDTNNEIFSEGYLQDNQIFEN